MNIYRKSDQTKYPAGDMPEYPARILLQHVLEKGVQSGAVVALFGLTPAYAYYAHIPMAQSWLKFVPLSPLFGSLVAVGMIHAKNNFGEAFTDEGVDDRAYRIAHNEKQTKVDKYSQIGAIAGATVGGVRGRGIKYVFGCASTGVVLGVLAYLGETYVLPKFK